MGGMVKALTTEEAVKKRWAGRGLTKDQLYNKITLAKEGEARQRKDILQGIKDNLEYHRQE